MPSFFVSDTNSLYKTNVSYLDTEDNKYAYLSHLGPIRDICHELNIV